MNGIYIRTPNEKTYNNAIACAAVSPWAFRFPNWQYNNIFTYKTAKKYYHGNSRLLLHLFYNDIINKYEMQATTATTEKSYPQNKKLNIYNLENINYELMCSIFGEAKQ